MTMLQDAIPFSIQGVFRFQDLYNDLGKYELNEIIALLLFEGLDPPYAVILDTYWSKYGYEEAVIILETALKKAKLPSVRISEIIGALHFFSGDPCPGCNAPQNGLFTQLSVGGVPTGFAIVRNHSTVCSCPSALKVEKCLTSTASTASAAEWWKYACSHGHSFVAQVEVDKYDCFSCMSRVKAQIHDNYRP